MFNAESLLDERIKEYQQILREAALRLGNLKSLQKDSDLQTQILIKTIQLPELKEKIQCYGKVVRDLMEIQAKINDDTQQLKK